MWYNNFLYEVPHELPNDSRIRKLRNIWITQNWVGTQPSSQIDLKKCIFGNNNRKSTYQSFLLLSRFARFFTDTFARLECESSLGCSAKLCN